MSIADQPVSTVHWIPLDRIEPNHYNPNSVARVLFAHTAYTRAWQTNRHMLLTHGRGTRPQVTK